MECFEEKLRDLQIYRGTLLIVFPTLRVLYSTSSISSRVYFNDIQLRRHHHRHRRGESNFSDHAREKERAGGGTNMCMYIYMYIYKERDRQRAKKI